MLPSRACFRLTDKAKINDISAQNVLRKINNHFVHYTIFFVILVR
ncbi:hypothetical protein CCAN2_1130006 [Capnocytophaga canimorsus]|nr:hypothetical protein CCAN2_1130006 [Capnocytophaga canimorsus]